MNEVWRLCKVSALESFLIYYPEEDYVIPEVGKPVDARVDNVPIHSSGGYNFGVIVLIIGNCNGSVLYS